MLWQNSWSITGQRHEKVTSISWIEQILSISNIGILKTPSQSELHCKHFQRESNRFSQVGKTTGIWNELLCKKNILQDGQSHWVKSSSQLIIRDLMHKRQWRQGWCLVKMYYYFTLEFCIYLELSSVSVCVKTYPSWICYDCIQIQIEIWKINHCGSHSPDNAEFGNFTGLFCRGQQRNVPRIITEVHSHCFAH